MPRARAGHVPVATAALRGGGEPLLVLGRANSDLRCNPHVHAIFLDGLYGPDRNGKGLMFHPAPAPSQEDIETIVERASKRILRFLQRRNVITLVTAPGDGEVTRRDRRDGARVLMEGS